MEREDQTQFEADTAAIVQEFLPIIRGMAIGRYAISIGGSHGKRRADPLSDIDFRLFCEEEPANPAQGAGPLGEIRAAMARWEARGRRIDGCWVRTIAAVERELDRWVAGHAEPEEIVWTVWGYYLPTDIANQQVIEDPDGLIAGWRERLFPYPPALKAALLKKHLAFLRYWRQDYHYANKVDRGDRVFLAGLSAKLVHSLLQVLYALNETYYPGDGHNLGMAEGFRIAPPDLRGEVERALYPPPGDRMLEEQRHRLLRLISAVERLAEEEAGPIPWGR